MQIKNVVGSYNSLHEIGCIVPARMKRMGVPPTCTIGISNTNNKCLLIEMAILETSNQRTALTRKYNHRTT
ncbi:hypothetical protein MA16_Dca027516 [Dendrobium catenatum]|uniref:Uncharacterized protein n=1 Tax=Dendrobium catenatum TaxID=906689 RepID=A0A2I0X1K1_9ASPA|nr:hypothetical protein MA16_Dca027516 [Dendrobium catenatum]